LRITEELNKNLTTLCMYQTKENTPWSAKDAGQIQPRIISTFDDFACRFLNGAVALVLLLIE
jgi:hypothetical protein